MTVVDSTTEQSVLRRQRNRFVTWLLRVTLALTLLLLLVVSYAFGSRYIASRRAEDMLSAISQSGLPTTRAEARQYFESLQAGPELSEDWNALFKAFEETNLDADLKELEKHGSLFPIPGDNSPDLVANTEVLTAFTTKHSALINQVRSTDRFPKQLIQYRCDYYS